MENQILAKNLKLLADLQELHKHNPFKIKAVANAAYVLKKYPENLKDLSPEEIAKIPGFGSSIVSKINEILQSGKLQELEDLLAETPPGVVEMLSIKGLGPKKARILWKELELTSPGEVLYACHENRLLELKGFGLKTQESIKQAIEFSINNSGYYLFAHSEPHAEEWLNTLKKLANENHKVEFTGAYRRKCEVLEKIEILISDYSNTLSSTFQDKLKQLNTSFIQMENSNLLLEFENHCPIEIIFSDEASFISNLFKTTGCEEHVNEIIALYADKQINFGPFEKEEEIYKKIGLAYIPAELRENQGEIDLAKDQEIPQLIVWEDLKGALHNHSTYSDGMQSLKEMALYCRDILKLEYLGIADHSQSAFYAQGLKEEEVIKQWAEIDELNQELHPFKILKGIESDILYDGSLDYPDEILAGFDYVVASVHSNLNMSKEKATERIIKAIENPYTTILGHPTGRLLLSRKGYEIDHEAIIDACAEHQVIIEINANPLRLDLDWRWIQYAIQKGVLLSINPDAHRTLGLHDMKYGVNISRKGGLSSNYCLNTFTLEAITAKFKQLKNRIIN